jgi:hypothetical protein
METQVFAAPSADPASALAVRRLAASQFGCAPS